VISTVAFCPQPPALVAPIATGAADELASVRTACTEAIGHLAGPDRRLVVLGPGPSSRYYGPSARGSMAGHGLAVEVSLGGQESDAPPELPLSLTVGAWLIGEALGGDSGAVGFSVGAGPDDTPSAELFGVLDADDVALLVMGDGSARRGSGAPGYFDPQAGPFDDAVLAALRAGDAAALAGLDRELGAAVLAEGTAAWRVAGRLLADATYAAELLYADDPYGVGYFVAVWTARG
jgi:hypothetical protein